MAHKQVERRIFPDPRDALADGLLMVGGDLTPETLLEAYSFGIFPWPQEGYPMLWFSPEHRGVIDFTKIHIPQSFKKFLKKCDWQITVNTEFQEVIERCQRAHRPGQAGTWISPQMKRAYLQFHRLGHAHSIEVWRGEKLIGGLYGVYVAGVFAGESMFYVEPNASKYGLWWLINHLKASGHTWMDTQMVTPIVKSFGGYYISRNLFLRRLEKAKSEKRPSPFTRQT